MTPEVCSIAFELDDRQVQVRRTNAALQSQKALLALIRCLRCADTSKYFLEKPYQHLT